jgi:hypothetical protein
MLLTIPVERDLKIQNTKWSRNARGERLLAHRCYQRNEPVTNVMTGYLVHTEVG